MKTKVENALLEAKLPNFEVVERQGFEQLTKRSGSNAKVLDRGRHRAECAKGGRAGLGKRPRVRHYDGAISLFAGS
jgi:hypothetical protein